jgi:hypothetical protein
MPADHVGALSLGFPLLSLLPSASHCAEAASEGFSSYHRNRQASGTMLKAILHVCICFQQHGLQNPFLTEEFCTRFQHGEGDMIFKMRLTVESELL